MMRKRSQFDFCCFSYFKKVRFFIVLAFCAGFVACKRPAAPDSAMTLSTSTTSEQLNCNLDENSLLIQKLRSFSYRGVRPYLGCPYQSEWPLYPSFSVRGQQGEFQQWMKNTFASLEQRSRASGPQYFADRYELYTVVMGEGLAFFFDTFANLQSQDESEYQQKLGEIIKLNQNPFSELFPLYNFLVERSFSRKSLVSTSEVRDFLVDPRSLPIYGFGLLGVDWFATEFRQLLERDYAKPYIGSFVENRDFIPIFVENELKEKVRTAIFKDLETGLNAFTAVYLERRNMFLSDARACQIGVPNDSDVLMYWTYHYFLRPDLAKQKFCRDRSLSFYQARPEEDGHRPQKIGMKLLKRLATRKFIAEEKVLE